MSQFIDHVRINVRSGDGGNGMVAWRREKYEPMGGPAGGSGGRGGHVYLAADPNQRTLIDFRYRSKFEAEPGQRGGPKSMHGRGGQDLIIKVPPGTVVTDLATGHVIADLSEPGQRYMVAEGGHGGRGNTQLASSTRRSPNFCEPGQPGVERELDLVLKLIADVGIIGLPNAGKSTLLSVLTAARPKIADYPFSTLTPQLGVVKQPSGDGYVLADIPGIVRGAAQGVGLGHKFLRHIERTRLLVHMADINSEDTLDNIAAVNQELHLYSTRLDRLPQLVVLNKADLVDADRLSETVETVRSGISALLPADYPHGEPKVLTISCATRQSLDELKDLILGQLAKLTERPAQPQVEEDSGVDARPDGGFVVIRKKGVFTVLGDKVERQVSVTDLRNPESLHHFYNVMRAMGVIEALIKEGVGPGSEVIMGGVTFVFGEEFM